MSPVAQPSTTMTGWLTQGNTAGKGKEKAKEENILFVVGYASVPDDFCFGKLTIVAVPILLEKNVFLKVDRQHSPISR